MRCLAGTYDTTARIGDDEHFRRLFQDSTRQSFRDQDLFLTLLLREISDHQTHTLKVVDSEAIAGQKCRYQRTVRRLQRHLTPAVAPCPAVEERHKVGQVAWRHKALHRRSCDVLERRPHHACKGQIRI